MKALVIFDSNFGNTKLVADGIAKQLGNGALSVSVNDLNDHSLDGIHLLVVGSPINAWRPTKKITAFLNGLHPFRMKGIKAAAFDTRVRFFLSGNAAKRIAAALKNSGADVIVPPVGFYVKGNEGPLFEGEMEKAEEWARLIKTKF
jgi:flavodoxin